MVSLGRIGFCLPAESWGGSSMSRIRDGEIPSLARCVLLSPWARNRNALQVNELKLSPDTWHGHCNRVRQLNKVFESVSDASCIPLAEEKNENNPEKS